MLANEFFGTVPSSRDEAAVRFAAVAFFGRETLPTMRDLSQWSGLSAETVRRELGRWHPQLLALIEGKRH